MIEAERARIDALLSRVGALEVELPLGQVEVHEEVAALEARLDAALARLSKLEAPESARPRGVIGALRVDRPGGEPDANPT